MFCNLTILLFNKKNVYRDHNSLTNDNRNYHKNFEDIIYLLFIIINKKKK